MGSQPVSVTGDAELLVVELGSFVRGYHAHIVQGWSPAIGQVPSIKREPDNPRDPHAVTVYCRSRTISHIPHNLAPTYSDFLRREVNKGVAVGFCTVCLSSIDHSSKATDYKVAYELSTSSLLQAKKLVCILPLPALSFQTHCGGLNID